MGASLFLLGGLAGAVVALAMAPKPGVQLRTEVREKAMKMFERPGAPPAEVRPAQA